jgi:hypothetical protein
MIRAAALPAVAIALTATAAACASPNEIEGYRLGQPAQCAPICGQFTDYASAWLDGESPGHAPVGSADVWTLDHIAFVRSGSRGDYVVVFRLEDGSVRAIFVGCGMGIDPDRCFTLPATQVP